MFRARDAYVWGIEGIKKFRSGFLFVKGGFFGSRKGTAEPFTEFLVFGTYCIQNRKTEFLLHAADDGGVYRKGGNEKEKDNPV